MYPKLCRFRHFRNILPFLRESRHLVLPQQNPTVQFRNSEREWLKLQKQQGLTASKCSREEVKLDVNEVTANSGQNIANLDEGQLHSKETNKHLLKNSCKNNKGGQERETSVQGKREAR